MKHSLVHCVKSISYQFIFFMTCNVASNYHDDYLNRCLIHKLDFFFKFSTIHFFPCILTLMRVFCLNVCLVRVNVTVNNRLSGRKK